MDRKIEIYHYRTPAEEFKAIAEKYSLEVEESKGSVWVQLRIPEANTEITWFKKDEQE